jgi:hypothetical protein
MLSKPTNNPGPTNRQVLIGGVVGGGLAAVVACLLGGAFYYMSDHPVLVWTGIGLTLGPVLLSAVIRVRKFDRSRLGKALLVKGFVPVGRHFRGTAHTVARRWLAQQTEPVAWVADEGLRAFYDSILACWQVTGERVNVGPGGFRSLLWPDRYLFRKP